MQRRPGAERDDERVDAQENDACSVDRAKKRAEHNDADKDGQHQRRVAIDRSGDELGQKADHRADREVDAAGQDDQRLSEADERKSGRLLINVPQITRRAEAVAH